MAEKLIILIVGANQGIGFHAAHQLAATGKYIVLLGSRDLAKGQKAVQDILNDKTTTVDPGNLIPIQIDLTSDESIYAAAKTIEEKFGRLDILICNAALGENTPNIPTRAQYQESFNTNAFGPVVCTETFLPLLRKSDETKGGKRIMFVSSGLASTVIATDPEFPFPAHMFPVYRASKAALNMSVLSFASLLEPEGFTVCALDPGHNKTNLNGFTGSKEPKDGARVIPMAVEAESKDLHRQWLHFENFERGYYQW